MSVEEINPHKLYTAHFMEVLLDVAAALRCRLTFKWAARRSSLMANLADDATHGLSSEVPAGTVCSIQQMPALCTTF